MSTISGKNTAKDHIAEALAEIIKEKHIEDITVAELSGKAGVGKSSFYRNYRDIYEVFEYLSNSFVNKVCDVMLEVVLNYKFEDFKGMPDNIDFSLVRDMLGFTDADTSVVNYLLNVKNSKVFRSVVKQFADNISESAMKNGLEPDMVKYITRFIANGVYYCILTSYVDEGKLEMEFIDILMSFNLNELKREG